MTKHDAHQGDEAHGHPHAPHPLNPEAVIQTSAGPIPPPPVPTTHEATHEMIQSRQAEWFAREYVGGLVAVARASGVDLADYLAERCAVLVLKLSEATAQNQVMQMQMQGIVMENNELRQKVEDCGCHDEAATVTGNGDG